MLRRWVFVWILASCGALCAEAEPEPMPPNAALKYWQALTLLPADAHEHANALFARPKLPETVLFVESCRNSLAMLHQGAAIQRAEWGIDEAAGPAALLPHLGKVRQLATVLVVAAQFDFADGKAKEGIDKLADALALARHCASGSMLIGKMVEVAITSTAMDALASHLPALAPEAIEHLNTRLAKLPAAVTLAEVFKNEQRMSMGWLRRNLLAMKGVDRFRFLKEAGVMNKVEDAPFYATLAADDKKLTEVLDEVDGFYANMIAIASGPVEKQAAEFTALDKKLQQGNVLMRTFMPAIPRMLQSARKTDIELEMIAAAADFVRGGAEALARHADPASGAPFAYAKVNEKEFTLTSRFETRDKLPFTVTFGKPQEPHGDANATTPVKPPGPPREQAGEF